MFVFSQTLILILLAAASGALVSWVITRYTSPCDALREQIKALSTQRDELVWTLEVRAGPDAHTVAASRRIVALERELANVRARADTLAAAYAKLLAAQPHNDQPTNPLTNDLITDISQQDSSDLAFVNKGFLRSPLAELSPAALKEAVKQAGVGTPPQRILPPSKPDDLTLITGVGPMNKAWLHAQGIYFLNQIANLSIEELAWLSNRLPAFGARVYRENWIAQACKLANEVSEPSHKQD
ncbi:hypothetical protein [Candidatus Phycosocius spiralis]|uniref:NADH dehydrogenase subunit E n=1 Tax=Candidatus Phycosocius spiralis TaxID=2815099 RepID=A0ABQ4PUW7_9PROT|nr:hypothetical protein [Candidatus Phycosocius spiralis]GIU66810.1 hypothetical protein PsB1_0964 [Candidatus Phycosocius spiralis]